MTKKIKLNYNQGAAPGTHEEVIRLFLKNTSPKKNYSYLDIGSGLGGLIGYVRDKRQFKEIYACDIDTSRFSLKGVTPKQVDVNKGLPFPDNSIDIITCVEVIEHIENFFFLIREIKRVLKKDGICIFSTPNLNSWFSRIKFLFAGYPSFFNERCYNGSGHINPIFDWNLIRLFNKEKISYQRSWNRFPIPRTSFQFPFKNAFFGEISIWLIKKR